MKYFLLGVAVVVSCVVVVYVGYSDRMQERTVFGAISSSNLNVNLPTERRESEVRELLPPEVISDSDAVEELSTETSSSSTNTPIVTTLPNKLIGRSLLSVDFLRKYYSSQSDRRRWQLKTINEDSNFATLYNVLVPEVYCPNLIRVGNVNDGGKWVCNPDMMPKKDCSIYSLGLRNDITFDREIQEFNNNSCKIYGYDMTAQSENTVEQYKKMNGEATQMTISNSTNVGAKESTLGDLLLSHGDNSTEFLKMDIEGAEYDTLTPFLGKFHVCQIFLEMHGKSHRMAKLLNEVASLDYMLFFYEVNGNSLGACEYSFIHRNCMERYGLFELGRYLGNVDQ